MTIGIGVLSSDGIVVASDSQVTTDIKLWRGKMVSLVSQNIAQQNDGSVLFSDRGGCAVAIAGQPAQYALAAAALITKTFDADRTLGGDQLKEAFESALSGFYAKYMVPRGGPSERDPSIQLLIATFRGGQRKLWFAEDPLLAPVSFYQSIGIGQTQSDPLLSQFIRVPTLDSAQTILLAAIVVHHTKAVNVWCGKSTDIVCVRDNSVFYIPRSLTKAIDESCDQHSGWILAATFREIVGALSASDRKALRSVRRDFRKHLSSIRKCLS